MMSDFVVTFVVRKQADGLFLDSCKEVSKLYPKIKFEGMIVDNACMQVSGLLICFYGLIL